MNTFDINTPMETRHRNLLRLANFLDDLPHDKFHMPSWASNDGDDNSCGTAGCACGWAATIFKEQGWSFRLFHPNLQTSNKVLLSGVVAFAEFFGISWNESWAITCFLEDHYKYQNPSSRFLSYCTEYNIASEFQITPHHAADRIRKVLKKVAPHLLEEEIAPVKNLVAMEV